MKYIKLFEDFSKLNENVQIDEKNEYVQLVTKGQNLEIKLVAKGSDLKELQQAHKKQGERCFDDFFDTIQGNSELLYFSNLGDAGFGLTDAPGITDGYYMNDDGDYESHDDARVWFYNDYMINDFVKELLTKKSVVFTLAD
jgi:hypothetical protein